MLHHAAEQEAKKPQQKGARTDITDPGITARARFVPQVLLQILQAMASAERADLEKDIAGTPNIKVSAGEKCGLNCSVAAK